MRKEDVTGQKFGRLVALRRAPSRGRKTFWLFRCDCGQEGEFALHHVKAGRSLSCGCWRREFCAVKAITHGLTRTATYDSWCHAKARCENPSDAAFAYYGGRGIRMVPEWSESFPRFLADMGEAPPRFTLERRDVDGPYSKDNCLWASKAAQNNNKRNTRWVEVAGERVSLATYALMRGVPDKRLRYRVRRGEAPQEAADFLIRQRDFLRVG